MKKGRVMMLAITGKVLAIVAREVVPVLLSVMLRDGIKKFIRKFKKDEAQPASASSPET